MLFGSESKQVKQWNNINNEIKRKQTEHWFHGFLSDIERDVWIFLSFIFYEDRTDVVFR